MYVCLAFGITGTACDSASSDAGADAAPDPVVACATQTIEADGTIVCTQAFADAPYVHLPDDTANHAYVGIVGGQVKSRTMPFQADDALLQAEASPTLRYAYTIYRATLSGGTVTALEPYVQLDDRVLLAPLAGLAIQGKLTPRDPNNPSEPFDLGVRNVDFRIELDDAPTAAVLDANGGFMRHALDGTIVNMDYEVTAADGSCLPSLFSYGETSPLNSAMGKRIRIMRTPAMHTPFDDVFTIDWPMQQWGNDMGSALFLPTIAFASATPIEIGDIEALPHGTPSSGPSFSAAVVTAGGDACPP